ARYLEFIVDDLDKPVYYVLGNHAEELTRGGDWGKRYRPQGCVDLCGKVVRDPGSGLILAGLPGSPKYNEAEPEQYTEAEMMWKMLAMTPRLLWNRYRHGRALDILVTHAPPRDVNDQPEDPAHRGFVAMRRFLRWFRPAYQLHGHIHLYDRSRSARTTFEGTEVINVFPYQELDLHVPAVEPAPVPVPAPITATTTAAGRLRTATRDMAQREVEPVAKSPLESHP
nr:metallophosphoesterase [Chloroflexia bacterium]